MSKIVLFQTIQFCISKQIGSIQSIDRTLLGATTLGQSEPGSNGVQRIPQSSNITGTSSDCLVSYSGHSLGGGSYPSAEKHSVYSATPFDRAKTFLSLSLTISERLVKFK